MKTSKTKYLIIGGGITGLTFANYCKDDYLIIEKDEVAGGYCRTFYKGSFVWDFAGHFFHFKTAEFKQKFIDSLPPDDFITKEKKTYIYYKDKLIDYPFQMNIHQLPKSEFIDCLYDLYNKKEQENYENFLDMLYGKFGESIVEKFLKPYNEKLYACDLQLLDKDAMGRFFPYADINSIINNMKKTRESSYNNTFMYPKKGAQVIVNILLRNISSEKIMYNTKVAEINIDKKIAKLDNGKIIEYENIINTIPFHHFLKLIDCKEYSDLSEKLTYNKVLVFNLGFNKKSSFNMQHWIYFPDKNINFYRVGFYDNILDSEKLSMYIEIGYDKNEEINIEEQLKLSLINLKKVKIIDDSFELEEYVSIVMNPAYIHIDTQNDLKVREILGELKKQGVYSIGRYGGWTYCSMEDCMIDAKNLADAVNELS